jgi:DNA invertase Pin-like site-specific DNA recombinase
MFSVLASIAEFENEIRKERQNEGIQVALEKGIKFGRTMKLSHRQIKQMKLDRESGLTISELENKYNLSKPSVYRYLRSKSDESEHSTQNL